MSMQCDNKLILISKVLGLVFSLIFSSSSNISIGGGGD